MKVIGLGSTLHIEKLAHTDHAIRTFFELDLKTLEGLMSNG